MTVVESLISFPQEAEAARIHLNLGRENFVSGQFLVGPPFCISREASRNGLVRFHSRECYSCVSRWWVLDM